MSTMDSTTLIATLLPLQGKLWVSDNHMPETKYDKLFSVHKESVKYYDGVRVASLGSAAVKDEGDSVLYRKMKQMSRYRIESQTLALGYRLTLEQQNYGDKKIMDVMKEGTIALKRGLAVAKEALHAQRLNQAFSSSLFTYSDGLALNTASHTSDFGTYSNIITAADLSESSIEQMVIQIMTTRADDGILMDLNPKQLVVPVNTMFDAHRIMKSALQSGTANNDTNALKDKGILKEIVEWKYLTDTDAFFITTDISPDNGLISLQAKEPEIHMDVDPNTLDIIVNAVEMYGIGAFDVRAIFGSAGS